MSEQTHDASHDVFKVQLLCSPSHPSVQVHSLSQVDFTVVASTILVVVSTENNQ